MDHVICKFNPKFTANSTCKLNFITRTDKSFTGVGIITEKLDNIHVHMQLYYKYRSGYKPFLVDMTTNLCEYLRKREMSKIFDIFLPIAKKYVKTGPGQELTCPYIGPISIVELPLNGSFVNTIFFPVGDYLVNVTYLTSSMEYIYNGKFYVTIPEGKTIEDDRMGR